MRQRHEACCDGTNFLENTAMFNWSEHVRKLALQGKATVTSKIGVPDGYTKSGKTKYSAVMKSDELLPSLSDKEEITDWLHGADAVKKTIKTVNGHLQGVETFQVTETAIRETVVMLVDDVHKPIRPNPLPEPSANGKKEETAIS